MKVNNKEQQETIDCLKGQMRVNDEKQQGAFDSLKQEMINLKKQQLECESFLPIKNLTKNNDEPLDEELMMISNILKEPSVNNKNIFN